MRGSWMTGIALPCGLAMTLAVMLLATCGPGNVAPGDDATGDDAVEGDDTSDDDAATGGTGTISVTVEVLAVLQEGQTVEAEIVVDGTPTGVFAPAEVEVENGQHTVTLKTNEPGAPVAQRFVAAPHEVSVTRDGTVACPMFLGRNLGGMWRKVEACGGPPSNNDAFEVFMEFFHSSALDWSPCPTSVWAGGWPAYQDTVCLLDSDRVWMELNDPEYPILTEGTILDNGSRMEYTVILWEEECPAGSYTFERVE